MSENAQPAVQPWHPYVFDLDRRAFVGDFESMYQAEARLAFDSWHQSDPRRLDSQVSLLLLGQITFRTALDVGCGKGAFTSALARRDNRVVGVDVSPTAVAAAAASFPDLDWVCAPIGEYVEHAPAVDLILAREVLSYVAEWRELLRSFAGLARYVLVSLYLPPEPIGFVKSHDELEAELDRHFELLDVVMLTQRRSGVYLAESRTRRPAEAES